MSANYKFKLIVVGSNSVGRRTLINGRDINDTFNQLKIQVYFSPIAVNLPNGSRCNFYVWNVPLVENYYPLSSHYYKGAAGCLLLFDLSDRETFVNLERWLRSVRNCEPYISVVLIGTKSDLEHQVSEEEVTDFVHEHGLDGYFLYSKFNPSKRQILLRQVAKILIDISEMPEQRKYYNDISKKEISHDLKIIREDNAYAYIKSSLKFRKFKEYYSTCPVCNKKNHIGSLQGLFYSPDPAKIILRDSLIRIMDEADYILDDKLKVGVPCCSCFDKVFKNMNL